ncbi:MAG: flavin reductase family protein [Chloroflexota bacterium]
MTVDRNTLRDTLRFWTSGVTVVATLAPQNALASAETAYPYAGMTVSSFLSLSLDPPQILVSLAKKSTTTDALLASGVFSVSILHADQAHLADRFAGRSGLSPQQDRFDGVAVHTAASGAPILSDALAWLDCRVHAVHDGSTHWIVVGSVLATRRANEAAPPLIYFNRDYVTPTPENEQP